MGGQCDKEVTAFLIHRTAHLMANLSIPEGIKPPLMGRASQGGTALLMQIPKQRACEGSRQAAGFNWEQARGCTSMRVSRLEHVGTVAV